MNHFALLEDDSVSESAEGSMLSSQLHINSTETPALALQSQESCSRTSLPLPSSLPHEASGTLLAPSQFSNDTTMGSTFDSLGVCPMLVQLLKQYTITIPTDIQRKSLPYTMKGRDFCGIARTGSGKTLCFALPILQELSQDPYGIFALILTPTRELALQIEQQMNAYGNPLGVQARSLIGGKESVEQSAILDSRPHILIATPGRLAFMLESNAAQKNFRRLKYFVLDEADVLLRGDPEFNKQLTMILTALPPINKRTTFLFTATLSSNLKHFLSSEPNTTIINDELEKRVERFVYVNTEGKDMALVQQLIQKYILIPQPSHKVTWLAWLLSMLSGIQINKRSDSTVINTEYRLDNLEGLSIDNSSPLGSKLTEEKRKELIVLGGVRSIIIFTDTCTSCSELEITLAELKFPVCALHGLMTLDQRIYNMKLFKTYQARILVATDLASRGLDIDTVDLVINYNVPSTPDDYIHRVGRTCRAGRDGCAITFIEASERDRLYAIEDQTQRRLSNLKYVIDRTNNDRVVRVSEEVVLTSYYIIVSSSNITAKLKREEQGITEQNEKRNKWRVEKRRGIKL